MPPAMLCTNVSISTTSQMWKGKIVFLCFFLSGLPSWMPSLFLKATNVMTCYEMLFHKFFTYLVLKGKPINRIIDLSYICKNIIAILASILATILNI